MSVAVRPLRAPNNVEVFNAIRGLSTVDYQRRIPAADKGNVQDVIHGLRTNRPSMNEFIDGLVNRIGLEIYRNRSWTNPLGKFKMGMLEYGDTIEEILVGLVEAKRYDPDRDSLEAEVFGQERPRTDVSYHKISRQDKYKISVNDAMIRRAFLNEFGLNNLVGQLMQAPQTSDNWDEFLLMSSLFKEMWRAGGFFKQNIPDIGAATSDGDDARVSLRRMREVAENLTFISERYNAAHMPTAAQPDDLELFITPEALAAQDVEALAGAFNIEKANFSARTTVIPKEHFNIPGAQAVLTTREFFVVADSLLETRQIQNPSALSTNFWLHHHQVISASRQVPAILFTTEESTPIVLDDTPVTDVAAPIVTDRDGTEVTKVQRGEIYDVSSYAITTPTGGENDAVRFALSGNKSPSTWLSQSGTLVVAPDEAGTVLTITPIAVDTDEYGDIQKSAQFTVYGEIVRLWPNAETVLDADSDGLNEVTPEAVPVAPTSGANKNKVTIPEVEHIDYKDGANVVSGDTITLTANKTITAVAQAGYELAQGATASWNLVFTA